MADNELALFQWQLGKQSAIATAVTPTVKLMGVEDGELTPKVETSVIEESRGSFAPAYDAVVDSIGGEASIPGKASFEQIPYYLDSMFGEATPGISPGYARAYAAPLTAKPTSQRMLTALRGSALDARCLKGALVNELTLKGESNKPVTFEAKLLGHSVESKALASLSDTTVNYIHSNQAAIKLDTWAGTMGTTALTPLAYSFELGLNMNLAMQMGLGAATPVAHKMNKADAGSNQLKLSMELASDSAGYLTSILTPSNNTPFRAQIQIGFTLGSLIFTFQFAGFAAEAPKFVGDTDGVASLDFTFSPLYHSTFANWFKCTVTNAVQALA
jgi:hypothetical protein